MLNSRYQCVVRYAARFIDYLKKAGICPNTSNEN